MFARHTVGRRSGSRCRNRKPGRSRNWARSRILVHSHIQAHMHNRIRSPCRIRSQRRNRGRMVRARIRNYVDRRSRSRIIQKYSHARQAS
jgi:hypothetical protein